MNISKAPYKVAILGGGISGLATAYFLKKKWGEKITLSLFEAQSRVGGWMQTVEKDGFLFELGPHSLRVKEDDAVVCLLKELGLEKQILQANSNAKNRYLFCNGKLQKMPSSLFSFFTHPIARICLRAFCKELFVSVSDCEETVASFFSRRFSSEIVDQFIDPLVKGIYGGDPHKLSMQCCFPNIVHLERRYGSLFKGFLLKKKEHSHIITLKNGLESLIKTLESQLKNCIHLNSPVQKISFANGKPILTINKQSLEFDIAISALPSFQLAKALNDPKMPMLSNIAFASFVVVNLGFKNCRMPIDGFGYLVPSVEKQNILGAVFDSKIFPEQNTERVTVMMGGWHQKDLLQLSEKQLCEIAVSTLSAHLKQDLRPDVYLVSKLENAVPQYFMGHQEAIEQAKQKLKNLPLHFIGNSYNGVSVCDCIYQAKCLSESLY